MSPLFLSLGFFVANLGLAVIVAVGLMLMSLYSPGKSCSKI